MLRALLLGLVMLAAAGPARAAGDIDTCRNSTAEPAARLAACESVIADEKITGPSRAAAFWFRGDSLVKKRDYDGAIAAFTTSHEIAPQNINVINARGIAYSYKGDDERALADYDLCLQLRPTYGSAYNNRGLIFMRRGELQRALDEFNLAVKHISNDQSRYLHHYNRGRVQGLLKQYDASLADFAEAQKVNPDGPQVPAYRCITYTGMGKFDEALADCNAALAKSPNNVLRADQPRQCLSRQGQSRRRPRRLRPGAQDQSELRSRLCRPRAAFRETPQPRRRTCRLSPGGQRRGGAARGHRHHACARRRQGAAGSLAGHGRADACGQGFAVDATTGGAAQGRADHRQRRLQERCAAGQSAARRQADRVDLSRARLCHGDAGARSHPG